MSTDRYDVIIIGSGAGGGTLAHKLAPSGKRILILERRLSAARARELAGRRGLWGRALQGARDLARQGWPSVPSRHSLLGRG